MADAVQEGVSAVPAVEQESRSFELPTEAPSADPVDDAAPPPAAADDGSSSSSSDDEEEKKTYTPAE
jgi:hypothetical protein